MSIAPERWTGDPTPTPEPATRRPAASVPTTVAEEGTPETTVARSTTTTGDPRRRRPHLEPKGSEMDLARVLRERLRQAFETGPEDAAGSGRSTNVAAAVNANGAGHVTSVYSDEHVTIIQRDGETEVIHHDQRPPGEHGGDVR